MTYLDHLQGVSEDDVTFLVAAEKSYGVSWKKRGGVDTFHMLARKWDRIEQRVATERRGASPYDIFEHIAADPSADGLLDDARDLRRYLMLVEAEVHARNGSSVDSGRGFLSKLKSVSAGDTATLLIKEKAYGSSWKRRGGIGAFMMLARKWDRIEYRVTTRIEPAAGHPGAARDNVFEHISVDRRVEGVFQDIQDLRCYLLLVEAEMQARAVTVSIPEPVPVEDSNRHALQPMDD
jgi:hypothetical protein